MGLRSRFFKMLGAEAGGQTDGGELRELVTVPMFEGPMLVSDLRDHGIEATTVDSFNLVSNVLSDVRVFVAMRDVDDAQVVLEARSAEQHE